MNRSITKRFNIIVRKVNYFVKTEKLPLLNLKQKTIITAFFTHHGIDYPKGKEEIKQHLIFIYETRQELFNFVVKRKQKKKKVVVKTFYDSDEWQTLRKMVLKFYGVKCMKCRAKKTEMHVDHIKPISKHPELKLCFGNLQVSRRKCNMEKSNIHETDYRPFSRQR